jgi:dipeptidyl aminopeptidase/acylaminoacyl peptidase
MAGAAWAALATAVAAAMPGLPNDAILSPNGTRAIWRTSDRTGVMGVMRKASNAAWSNPKKLLTIHGLVARPVFSPDGSRIAFANPRGGYATGGWGPMRNFAWSFIAVYDFAAARLSYVNPGFARDDAPAWSADGRSLSYVRRVEGLADQKLTSPLAEPARTAPAALRTLLAAPAVAQASRSGDGRTIAFASREGAVRGIYFAQAGSPARAMVRYADDDGQELSGVALSQHGTLLAFVRGSAPNSRDEIANPNSLTNPPARQIFLVDTGAPGTPRLLATGWSPLFSPDGTRLIWQTAGGVMTAPLSTAAGKVTVGTPEPLLPGPVDQLSFSPDGTRLAYVRTSFVETYDLTDGSLHALQKPADARDSDPVWSPDSRRIAFRRTTGTDPFIVAREGYTGDYASKTPWAIWAADVHGGEPKQLWQAKAGTGSAYYPLDQDATASGVDRAQLFWSTRDAIAFVWERDGWRHLYAIPTGGGEARLLTPGDGEVESAALSFNGAGLVYATNIGDLDRRRIMAVGFDGVAPSPIAAGMASAWGATPLAGGKTAYISADWANPPAMMVRDATGTTSAVGGTLPWTKPAGMVEPQPVSFRATDGETAYGQLFRPAASNGCAVVFVHGGIKRQMLLGFHYMEAYSNLYEMNQYLAAEGCVVLSVEYRSSIMRGYAFRNATDWGYGGASEVRDIAGAAAYLKSRADLGVRHIGIYGLSWGGYLTAQALARHSDIFEAGFDMAGVHEFAGERRKNSPVAAIDGWTSPLLLMAGDDDRNVDFSQDMLLYQALRTRRPQVPVSIRVFPNEVHDLNLTYAHIVAAYAEGSGFLLARLGGAGPAVPGNAK